MRLFEDHLLNGRFPSALDLPTGLGKTSVMTVWYLAWRADAPVLRRLVYVVDRRAVVDQATAIAESIKQRAPVRILIYCNSRDVAQKTKKAIAKRGKSVQIPLENVQLFVGERRVKEREDAKKKLEGLGFFSGNDAPDKPAFVIATSAGGYPKCKSLGLIAADFDKLSHRKP